MPGHEEPSASVATAVSATGVLAALDPAKDVLKARQRGAAGSTLKDKVASWLHSEEGREWMRERRELYEFEDEA